MVNLYPQLMANGNTTNNNGGGGGVGGSFDDYDSIIDEFSIGCENSDISSMHMSDMGEIITAAGGGGCGGGTANTNDNNAAMEEVTSTSNANTAPISDAISSSSSSSLLLSRQEGSGTDNDGAITTMLDNNDEFNDLHNDSTNGYYYHVGDLYHVDTLGLDNTDMSAILGLAPSSSSSFSAYSIGTSVDAESLLPNHHEAKRGVDHGDEEDQHSLPSVYAIKNDVLMMVHNKSMNETLESKNNHQNTERIVHDDDDDGMNQSSVAKQLGPLGDELSYVDTSLKYQQQDRYDTYNQRDKNFEADDDDDEEEEDNANDCILPNLITYSSRRSKCVTVFSTAFILGVLVFALVAVGVTYSSTGSVNPFSSSSSNAIQSTGSSASSESASLVDRVEDRNNNVDIDSVKLPSESSTNDEADDEGKDTPVNSSSKESTSFTSRPTVSLTTAGTSTAIVASSTSSLPTSSPRNDDDDDDDEVEDKLNQQQQMIKSVPTSMPSAQPSLLRRQPSSAPTLSSNPTSVPSVSSVPSITPTTSSQPSWPVGNESIEEGDARFYLMADGGSNRQFWANKLEKLQMEQHKFIVHLGSAIRVVDDCDPDAYVRTEESLSNTPIPVYSIPGDNDYPKCTNPSEGWENYQQSMMNINTKYWDIPQEYDVKRQFNRQENFAFLYRRVLFIGLNMVSNIDDEWETAFRVQDNIDWVRETVEAYWENADAIFVMGYGRLLATESAPFYDAMVSMMKKDDWADKLFVYARRSSELDIERDVGGNKNFIELRVAAEWPILDVRVRTRMDGSPKLDFVAVDENEIV